MLLNLRLLILATILLLYGCSKVELPTLKPLSDKAVILAFGDSLTYGTGASVGQSYPEVLSQLTGHPVINAGIPGEISAEGLQRLPALLDKHQPELLILTHGANDILRHLDLQSMQDNLEQMLVLAEQRNIQILMLAVPEFNLFMLNSAPLYAELAAQHNIPIHSSLLADILSDRSLKADTVHPNQAGYKLMAQGIFTSLQNAGAL